jgi:hypothetical protein
MAKTKLCKLTLHEAICVVLLSKKNRTASFSEITKEIAKRNLFIRPSDGLPPPSKQIKLRTTLAQGQYYHLFEQVGEDWVRLRNCEFA